VDTDQKILFDDKYPRFECKDLTINNDSKYFGWMKKDNE